MKCLASLLGNFGNTALMSLVSRLLSDYPKGTLCTIPKKETVPEVFGDGFVSPCCEKGFPVLFFI